MEKIQKKIQGPGLVLAIWKQDRRSALPLRFDIEARDLILYVPGNDVSEAGFKRGTRLDAKLLARFGDIRHSSFRSSVRQVHRSRFEIYLNTFAH